MNGFANKTMRSLSIQMGNIRLSAQKMSKQMTFMLSKPNNY